MEKSEVKSRKQPPMERRRPAAMLKDFLRDDLSSCSSSGFRSFPRRSCYSSSVRSLLEKDLKANEHDPRNSSKLLRQNRSKSASTTASALQKATEMVMSVVKHFQFPSVKYSSFGTKQGNLARNLSRRLRRSFTKRSRSSKEKHEITVVVKVKDIVRWKSFRDLVEEKQKPIMNEFYVSPLLPIMTTTTTTTTASHSWSDCDFTSEYLHSSRSSSDYSGENEVDDHKKELTAHEKTKRQISMNRGKGAGEDSMKKGQQRHEKDQFSPVSVHDFPCEDDEETPSSFQSSLDKMERTKQKLMQKIRRFENLCKLEPVDLEKRIASFELDDPMECCPSDSSSMDDTGIDDQISEEENDESVLIAELKARTLLDLLMDSSNTSSEDGCETTTGALLVDFFTERVTEQNLFRKRTTPVDDDESNEELLREAGEWMSGECETLDMRLEESREVHIREMEKGLSWKKFEVEQEELAFELESAVFGSLMNELVHDLLSNIN